eukprot:scaffold443_cov527-Prasinococcus_capsulatus_cf.AAC.9
MEAGPSMAATRQTYHNFPGLATAARRPADTYTLSLHPWAGFNRAQEVHASDMQWNMALGVPMQEASTEP